jgi:outer membrane protein
MSFYKINILLTLFFLTVNSSFSQSKYTLIECIQLAKNNNPENKIAALQWKISKVDYSNAKTSLLPTLSFNANQGYNMGRSIDRFTNQFVNRTIQSDFFSLGSSLILFNGLQMQNNIKFQRTLSQSTYKELETRNNQIALNVSSGFLNVLLSKEIVSGYKSQIENTQLQLDRTRKMTNAGAIDRSVLLALESQLANEELALIEAVNQLRLNKVNLQNLCLFKELGDWDIVAPLMEEMPLYKAFVSEEVYQKALQIMPEIENNRLRVIASEYQTKMAKGMRSPTLAFNANMNTVYSENALQVVSAVPTGTQVVGFVRGTNDIVEFPTYSIDTRIIPFDQQVRSNFGQTIGFSLSWNIFNGMNVNNNIKKSQLQEEIQLNYYAIAKNNLLANVNKSVTDYEGSWSRWKASQKAEESALLQYEFANKKFENGLIHSFEFLNAKNQYAQATIKTAQAKYQFLFNKMILEFYMGNGIGL